MSLSKNGFTLIELAVIIVIVAVLAVVAAPRFLTVSSDARESMLKGVAAEFQQAINFGQQKWAIEGRANSPQVNLPNYANGEVDFNDVGFPIGTDKNVAFKAPYNIGIGEPACSLLFEAILVTSLTATQVFNQAESHDFYARRVDGNLADGSGPYKTKCFYAYTKEGFNQDPDLTSHVIWYDSRTGNVWYANND
ncbi:prepilin-type N-terminal cleavage/methylation domain-containing protein [Vibrio sp. UCD-FRSSP16_10]|uniref:prepilin-type N-terminal cleavage/methylation domain-containing protein n=1 Tax=unclassified Vibrio TaxID=2614977 RepID=UPI0007FFAE05|nr:MULTISPECIES: prepilin-type N-terminal cleavage/methylation domain-containing protein [unclassified Vibrio]OBT08598.1 prepilin-type N-terminal cleavage/methylation domain-containing protein [Vibrio sp. UCD-FRSSP16_30]OBT18128.1 prepilin-type N-terminal cleavage/methylation domain-containing protein [Vibrio sp. UCD-FRSSP16_10]